MNRSLTFYLTRLRLLPDELDALFTRQRVIAALARGAAGSSARSVSLSDPRSWEFSGFSQNGEDGLLDTLTRQIRDPNRYFVEIGSSHGLENNTSWLAVVRRYSGLMVEGERRAAERCNTAVGSPWVRVLQLFVTRENIEQLRRFALHHDPDVFSVDVDGNDYYLVKAALEAGFRPRIWMVEFNSAFGPDAMLTIPYDPAFRADLDLDRRLYYGCSISGWRGLFQQWNYRFVTVDSNGVNAVFVDPAHFDSDFIDGVQALCFAENHLQYHLYGGGWQAQFPLLAAQKLVTLPPGESVASHSGTRVR